MSSTFVVVKFDFGLSDCDSLAKVSSYSGTLLWAKSAFSDLFSGEQMC